MTEQAVLNYPGGAVPADDSGPIARGSRKERTLSVRVPEHTVHLLMGLSLVDDITLAETIRKALTTYVGTRRDEEGFVDELEAAKQRQLAALSHLEAD